MLCREDDLFHLKFASEKTLLAILSEIGHIPLPPYIERADNENDLTRYQTVFGKIWEQLPRQQRGCILMK